MASKLKSFSFLVLAYNHEQYIVQHLESIKYLVERYGAGIRVEIIVNDDCSRDATAEIIDKWLVDNGHLFERVLKLFNSKNIGTCASVVNMLGFVTGDCYKLTAGDDVYSFENIFELAVQGGEVSIASGLPLDLRDGLVTEKISDIFGIISTQIIYDKKQLPERFKFLSNNNAPNILYLPAYISDLSVVSFLRKFDVIEDWPIQVAISEKYPDSKFLLLDKVYVYYRRTPGSTYLVAGGRFYRDKCKLYEYLISKEARFFSRVLLRNRYFCFRLGSPFVNKFGNLAFIFFAVGVVANFFEIHRRFKRLDTKLSLHQDHYNYILGRSLRSNGVSG
ncbi:glycosyltransferase family 2 protein [Pseudomonas sp. OA3]|jgi:glycosyltransferase involved in cell wall biosynthesis|nr:glycosyltransferase family 2 protein [Pseudomonas sp. OA3]